MLELSKITATNAVDIIISQIREMIISKTLKMGDKLPPERKLAEQFGVSRSQVREAINKLQFYGMVKVQPQSGTVVSGVGINAFQGLLTDVLKIEKSDFQSLVDTRILLEKEAARLAALNRTEEDITSISEALGQYEDRLSTHKDAEKEDLLFHIKIAEASGNTVLKALMQIISPDIVSSIIELKVCNDVSNRKTINEHRQILESIINQNPDGAVDAMQVHLDDLRKFSESIPVGNKE